MENYINDMLNDITEEMLISNGIVKMQLIGEQGFNPRMVIFYTNGTSINIDGGINIITRINILKKFSK